MKIVEITDKTKWDKAIKSLGKRNYFTQSWQWGEILISEGKEIARLALVEKTKIVALGSIMYTHLPLGMKYAFAPNGPIAEKKYYKYFLQFLKKKKCIFFRIEPEEFDSKDKNTIKTIDTTPRATTVLDIQKSEEDILKKMKSKTRYNIRLAQKKNIQISENKDLSSFIQLSQQTSMRDKFSLHPKKHYEEILGSEISYQLSAVSNDKTIASAVFISFGDTFTYMFGASDYDNRNLMAPHLLQWEGIKLAKKLGYKYYDFFGIAPRSITNEKTASYSYDEKHQYAGVTRFKIGFGGRVSQNAGTYDIILNGKKYLVYKLFRKIRRLI